jgi:RHS repeat-associated protein
MGESSRAGRQVECNSLVRCCDRCVGALLAEADGTTGAITRDYIWLPVDDVSPAADNDSEEGAQTPPLPLGIVTGVNTPAPSLLMVHADHLGRPARLTDATRATVWQASYDPFGQPWQITGAVEQNLRFPGQYFLLESGLSYNWHRVYDASTGRYTQPDPLRFVDGPSVYGYATASPMMRVDPEGLSPSSVICSLNPVACGSICLIVPSVCQPSPSQCFAGGAPYSPSKPSPLPIKPPADASDPEGPKAPGYPGDIPGYEDPKGGPDWVPNPNGSGYGWRSKDGKVWVPTGPRKSRAHGGPHWDVQDPRNKKKYGNVFPPK